MVRKQKKRKDGIWLNKNYSVSDEKNSDLLKTVALSAKNNGCLAGKALNSKEQGRPPTTISLRESKAASQWRKKNTAPAKGEDIVCAGVKASEVCR